VVLQRLRAIRARLTVRLESQYRAYQRSQRLLGGGGGGGGSSRSASAAAAAAAPAIAGIGTTNALTTYGMAERIAAREQAAPVNIVVNGGISTSAEIGQSVYNALLQYKQVHGPLRGFE
jgi:hypothetical protein